MPKVMILVIIFFSVHATARYFCLNRLSLCLLPLNKQTIGLTTPIVLLSGH